MFPTSPNIALVTTSAFTTFAMTTAPAPTLTLAPTSTPSTPTSSSPTSSPTPTLSSTTPSPTSTPTSTSSPTSTSALPPTSASVTSTSTSTPTSPAATPTPIPVPTSTPGASTAIPTTTSSSMPTPALTTPPASTPTPTPLATTELTPTPTPAPTSTPSASSVIISEWNFMSSSQYIVAQPVNSPVPSTGVGTAVAVGMANNYSYPPGSTTVVGASTWCDVIQSSLPSGQIHEWRVRGQYPGNGWSNSAPQYSQGVEFSVSTVGYFNVGVLLVLSTSSTSACRNLQLRYSVDGGSFWQNIGPQVNLTLQSLQHVSADLSDVPGVDNNALFKIRAVSAYDVTGTYSSIQSTDTTIVPYNSVSGNWRIDLLSVSGSKILPPIDYNLYFSMPVSISWSSLVPSCYVAALQGFGLFSFASVNDVLGMASTLSSLGFGDQPAWYLCSFSASSSISVISFSILLPAFTPIHISLLNATKTTMINGTQSVVNVFVSHCAQQSSNASCATVSTVDPRAAITSRCLLSSLSFSSASLASSLSPAFQPSVFDYRIQYTRSVMNITASLSTSNCSGAFYVYLYSSIDAMHASQVAQAALASTTQLMNVTAHAFDVGQQIINFVPPPAPYVVLHVVVKSVDLAYVTMYAVTIYVDVDFCSVYGCGGGLCGQSFKSWGCGPSLIPFSLVPRRLSSVTGGDFLSFLVQSGSVPFNVTYGTPMNNTALNTSLAHMNIAFDCMLQSSASTPSSVSVTNTFVPSLSQNQSYLTSVSCMSTPGVGANLVVQLTFCLPWPLSSSSCLSPTCLQRSSSCYTTFSSDSDSLSYPAPIISPLSLALVEDPANRGNSVTQETLSSTDIQVEFSGQHFSPFTVLMSVMMVNGGDPNLRYACVLTNPVTTTKITCRVDPEAKGVNYYFVVTCYNQIAVGNDYFNYANVPSLYAVSGCAVDSVSGNATTDCPTQGGVLLTLTGSNFVKPLSVFVGGSPCLNVTLNSDNTVIVCGPLPPGAGAQQIVTVNSNHFSVSKIALSYAAPAVDNISSSSCFSFSDTVVFNCNRNGGAQLTIYGSNFGASGATVFVGQRLCDSVTHATVAPDTRLTCVLPAGKGLNQPVVVLQENGKLSQSQGSAVALVSYADCDIGQYDNLQAWEDFACYPCQAGRWSNVNGSGACTPCPRGTYRNLDTISSFGCKPCLANTYSDSEGATVCTSCEQGSWSLSGSSTCSYCSSSTYLIPSLYNVSQQLDLSLDVSTQHTCNPCPSTAQCSQGSVLATAGYYVTMLSTGVVLSEACAADVCLDAQACLSSSLSSSTSPPPSPPLSSSKSFQYSRTVNCCAVNRQDALINPLCAHCVDDLAWMQGACISCSTINFPLLLFALLILFIVTGVLHIAAQRQNPDVKVSIYFIQMAVALVGSSTQLVAWSGFFTSGNPSVLLGQVCILPLTAMQQLLLGVFGPLLLIACLSFIAASHLALRSCVYRIQCCQRLHRRLTVKPNGSAMSDSRHAGSASGAARQVSLLQPFVLSSYIRSLCSLFLFSYNSIVSTTFTFLHCKQVSDNLRVVAKYNTIDCDSDSYRQLYPLFVALLTVIIGLVPIVLAVGLFLSNRRGTLHQEANKRRYGVWFEVYKPSFYFWEVFCIVRRVLLLATIEFLSSSRVTSYAVSAILTLLTLLSVIRAQPYLDGKDTHVDALSQSSLCVLCMLLCAFDTPYTIFGTLLICIFVYVPSISLLIVVFVRRVHRLRVLLCAGVKSRKNNFHRASVMPSPLQQEQRQEQRLSHLVVVDAALEGEREEEKKKPQHLSDVSNDNALQDVLAHPHSVRLDGVPPLTALRHSVPISHLLHKQHPHPGDGKRLNTSVPSSSMQSPSLGFAFSSLSSPPQSAQGIQLQVMSRLNDDIAEHGTDAEHGQKNVTRTIDQLKESNYKLK